MEEREGAKRKRKERRDGVRLGTRANQFFPGSVRVRRKGNEYRRVGSAEIAPGKKRRTQGNGATVTRHVPSAKTILE